MEPEHTTSSWRRGARAVTSAFLLLCAASCLFWAWQYGRRFLGIDYYQFWAVGQAVSGLGIREVYSDEARERITPELLRRERESGVVSRLTGVAARRPVLETYSTPFLYQAIRAISGGDYERDYRRFLLLTLGCTVVAVATIGRLVGFGTGGMALCFLAFTAWFAPFRSDVRVGNVNQIQVGLLAAYLWIRSREGSARWDALGGAVLGAAVAFKPDLVAVLGMILFSRFAKRDSGTLGREAAGMVAGLTGAIASSSAWFGSPRIWSDWLAAIASLPEEIIGLKVGNFSLVRFVENLSGARLGIAPAALLTAAALAAVWIGSRRGAPGAAGGDARGKALHDLRTVGIGCALYLLSAPLVWVHYYWLATPLALLALRPSSPALAMPRTVPVRRILGGLAVVFLANRPFEWALKTQRQGLMAALSGAGILLLFGMALWEAAAGAGPGGRSGSPVLAPTKRDAARTS